MSTAALPNGWQNACEILRQKFDALPTAGALGPQEAEVMYGIAYSLLEQNQFEKAQPFFHILATYHPLVKKFWLGFGYSLRMLERLDEAIYVYSLLGVIHPGSPEALLGTAECQLQKGDSARASASLQMVIDFCESNGGFDEVESRARGIQALMQV